MYVCVSCLCGLCMCPLPLLIQLTTEGGAPSHCELIALTLGVKHTTHKETSSTALNQSLAQARGAHLTWTLGTTRRCPKWVLFNEQKGLAKTKLHRFLLFNESILKKLNFQQFPEIDAIV